VPEGDIRESLHAENKALRMDLAEALEVALGSAEQFHVLASTINQGAALLSPDGRIQYANAPFAALFGKLPAQVREISITELLPAEARPLMLALLRECLSSSSQGMSSASVFPLSQAGEPPVLYRFSCASAAQDGSTVIVIIASEVHHPQPASRGISPWVASAATEQTAFRQLAENFPEPVFILDRAGRIVSANAAVRDWGWTPDELRGRPLTELTAVGSRGALLEALESGHHEGSAPVELEMLRESGGTRRARAVFSIFPGPGQAGHAFMILAEAGRMPATAPEGYALQNIGSVSELAAGVAHGFNNIFQIILAYTELCEQNAGRSGAISGYIGEITRAVRRGAVMTDQLLNSSRERPLKAAEVDLNSLLRAGEEFLGVLANDGITLELDLDPGLEAAWVNPVQVEELVRKVVLNARSALGRKGTLRLVTRNAHLRMESAVMPPLSRARSFVSITIETVGPRVNGGAHSGLFSPFFDPEDPGIGWVAAPLSIFGIVSACQGHLSVHPDDGGPSVTIYLPRAREGRGTD
jgi:PAS domain S-box-containing protein